MTEEFEELSQIIEADDPRFDEIWDEKISLPEEETKDSLPVVSATESETEIESEAESALKSQKEAQSEPRDDPVDNKSEPILQRLSKPAPKPKREKVTISSITAENQSIISTISKSTFISRSSTLDMTSVVVDSPLDREVSEITTIMRIQPMRPPEENSIEGGVFLNLYESMVTEQALNMPRCVNKEDVVENKTDDSAEKELSEVMKQDETTSDSKQAKVGATKPPVQESCRSRFRSCSRKTIPSKVFNNDSEPIGSIPDFLAATAAQFVSSSLNFDDDMSQGSIYASEEDLNNSTHEIAPQLEWTDTDIAIATADLPAMTLAEKRLDERSLLDIVSHEEDQDEVILEDSASEDRTEDLVEDENITEGLGLILPPLLPQIPQTAETQDQQETNQGKIESDSGETKMGQNDSDSGDRGEIEVDEVGQILINDGVDSVESSDDHQLRQYQDFPPSERDVYLTHRIKAYQSNDNSSLSPSEDSVFEQAPPVKQNSGLKKFLKPKWKTRIKFFSGSKGKENEGKKKTTKSIHNSPTRTVNTVATATTTSSLTAEAYANMKFAAEFPVSRKYLPNFIRPKTNA